MKNFYEGGRELCPYRDRYLYISYNGKLILNLYRWLRHGLQIFVFLTFCFIGAAKAQSRPPVGAAEVVKPLQIGDTIPEELWNMPLQVVNHPDGKDTITLNDYRDKKLIILDFWATWCAPCIKSLENIQTILSEGEYQKTASFFPVLVHDTKLRGQTFLDDRDLDLWSSHDKNYELREYFSNYITGFGVVILSDGRFVGAPIPKTVDRESIERQISEGDKMRWNNVEDRRIGGNDE